MGKDIDTQEISNMITSNVQSMIAPSKIGHTLTRVILSRTGNDMNKRKYIASILFFGGRCCYCGKVIHKIKGSIPQHDSATTEHIDPMAGRPHGETKYGNVALCCEECNADKANASFNSWMKNNTIMDDEQKTEAKRRISEFRKYTMYEPMSMKKSNNIDHIIAKAKKQISQSSQENNRKNKSTRNEEKEIREQHLMEYRKQHKENIASIKRTAIQEAMMA
jgi:Tfp pilus assembly protein PilP